MTPVTTRIGVMAPVVGRITEKATFRALARSRRRGSAGPFTVSYCAPERAPEVSTPGHPGFPRVGYAVSKQVGNAVVRNRVRRRLRAATRSLAPSLPSGAYLVRAAPGTLGVDFSDTCDLLGRAAMAAARRDDRGRGVRAPGDRAPDDRAPDDRAPGVRA